MFRGVLHRKGSLEIMVAIKMYSDLLTSNNVWHFVDEERALRYGYQKTIFFHRVVFI